MKQGMNKKGNDIRHMGRVLKMVGAIQIVTVLVGSHNNLRIPTLKGGGFSGNPELCNV